MASCTPRLQSTRTFPKNDDSPTTTRSASKSTKPPGSISSSMWTSSQTWPRVGIKLSRGILRPWWPWKSWASCFKIRTCMRLKFQLSGFCIICMLRVRGFIPLRGPKGLLTFRNCRQRILLSCPPRRRLSHGTHPLIKFLKYCWINSEPLGPFIPLK